MKLNKKQIRTIISIVVVLAVALVGWFIKRNEKKVVVEGTCFVHYIDVGQGDCELIESDGEFMLIDAGENGNEQTVINYLRDAGVETIKYVVATHPHSDHIGGLAEVINEFTPANIIAPELANSLHIRRPNDNCLRIFR